MDSLFDQLTGPFKRTFGLTFCFHDYSGLLETKTSFENRYHSYISCAKVKQAGFLKQCISFDRVQAQSHLLRYSQPFFKCCHAGIIEHVSPLKINNIISGVMFTGLFTWQDDAPLPETILTTAGNSPSACHILAPHTQPHFYPLTKSTIDDIAAICRTIANQLEQALAEQALAIPHEYDLKWQIEAFISAKCQTPLTIGNLARHIGLSESRTSHLLKTYFNQTFPGLLNNYRLRHAKKLLTYTGLSVKEIASIAGYNDPGYFYRIFRRIEKVTPLQYRQRFSKDTSSAADT